MSSTERLRFAIGGISLVLAAGLCGAPGHTQAEPAQPLLAQRARARTLSAYDSIAVAQPANAATVFDNAGNVVVAVAVAPALDTEAGDRIALMLDGRQAALRSTTRFKLRAITRGEHTLEAQVLDADGNALIASARVTFQLWQASRLFPNRRGK